MIQCDNGHIKILGPDATTILAELECAIHAVFYDILIDQEGMARRAARDKIISAVSAAMIPLEPRERETRAPRAVKMSEIVQICDALGVALNDMLAVAGALSARGDAEDEQ